MDATQSTAVLGPAPFTGSFGQNLLSNSVVEQKEILGIALNSLSNYRLIPDETMSVTYVYELGADITDPRLKRRITELCGKGTAVDPQMITLCQNHLSSIQSEGENRLPSCEYFILEGVLHNLFLKNGKLSVQDGGEYYDLGITPAALIMLVSQTLQKAKVVSQFFQVLEKKMLGMHEFIRVTWPNHHFIHIHGRDLMIPSSGHCIGRGGGGVVFKTFDLVTRQIFAVKESYEEDNKTRSAVEEELEMMSLINPGNKMPYIIQVPTAVYRSLKGVRRSGIVEEYCPHGDLSKHLSSLNWEQRFKICSDLLEIGVYVNSIPFLNADIKLENLLLRRDFQVCLSDFDKVWRLDTKELLKKICTLRVPDNSLNACHPTDIDWLDVLGKAVKSKKEKVDKLNGQKSKSSPQLIQKAEGKLEKLLKHYQSLAQGLHTWAIGYAILQVLTGNKLNEKKHARMSVQEKLTLLDGAAQPSDNHCPEKRRLMGIRENLGMMLEAYPSAPKKVRTKSSFPSRIELASVKDKMVQVMIPPKEGKEPAEAKGRLRSSSGYRQLRRLSTNSLFSLASRTSETSISKGGGDRRNSTKVEGEPLSRMSGEILVEGQRKRGSTEPPKIIQKRSSADRFCEEKPPHPPLERVLSQRSPLIPSLATSSSSSPPTPSSSVDSVLSSLSAPSPVANSKETSKVPTSACSPLMPSSPTHTSTSLIPSSSSSPTLERAGREDLSSLQRQTPH